MKQDAGSKVVSYSPDGRTQFEVQYIKDEAPAGETGFKIENPTRDGEALYYGWVKEGSFSQMDELKAKPADDSKGLQ